MLKNLLILTTAFFMLAGCTSLKPVQQQTPVSQASPAQQQTKFIEEITVTPSSTIVENNTPVRKSSGAATIKEEKLFVNAPAEIELASALQLKYAVLLDTEVEQVKNLKMFEYIDQWYGTRYCLGGTTKSCIDCSAFVQLLFGAIYNITLPRTAREQYRSSKRISRTELKEGDLLFFNTRGGISHVGVYLQNNKFVHASSSDGVTISDIFDAYWVRKFIGVGRVEDKISIADSQ